MDPFIIANFIPCFHCVKLHYSALMQLRASERASERERTDGRSFAAYSLSFSRSLVWCSLLGLMASIDFRWLPSNFSYILMPIDRTLPLARLFGTNQTPWQMAPSLCLSAFLFRSLSLSPSLFLFPLRTQIYTIHTHVHSRTISTCPLENGNAAAGLRFPVS